MSKSNLQLALEIALKTKNVDDINVLTKELEKAGVNFDDLQKSSNKLSQAWEKLNPEQQAKKLKKLSDEAKRLEEITKAKITLGIDNDDKARKQIEEVTKAYETLKKSGKLSSVELARANDLHTKKVAELENQLGKTAPQVTNLTAEMGKLATASAGLAYISKSAISFEQAMAGVKKTVNGTPEEIQSLSAEIKQLSVDLGLSSEAVAAIAAQGGQLGIPIEKLRQFTELAGKMAVAFDMTAEEAAEAAAKLANVFDIPITQVDALGDAINTLGNNTAAKEREIVASLLRIGGSAKQFGLAEEQAASLAAAMIALGKPPEVAATAINALLTKLQTAQTQGEKFQSALASIGTSADVMAQNIQANPQQALSDFLEKLGELDKQQRAIATAELFGQEYSDDISLLVGSLETYNNALGLTANKSENAGAMQKEFESQMATTGKEIQKAQQSLTVLTQTLGAHLLPIISTVAGGFTDITTAVNDFATTYPNITQFGVLLTSGLIALKTLNSAMKLSGVIGLKSGADIAKSFALAKRPVELTAKSFDKLASSQYLASRSSRTVTGDFKNMATQMKTLEGLFAASLAWEIGTGIGEWLYENTEGAKLLGDNLARVIAYGDALFTDRTFEDVEKNFETSAETAKRLADATQNASEKTQTLAEKQKQAATEAQNQADANRNLVNDIIITRAELEQMSETLAKMEAEGKKGSEGYKELAIKLKETQTALDNLTNKAKANGLGEQLKTDLEKASGAFKALGLDAKEFSTGISSDINTALDAYVQVSKLAGDNTDQLARAYNAVIEKVGDNAQAQSLLEQKLKQVTQGNKDLAQSVKDTALAQQQAKTATDDQKKALDALGISMEAVNAKMSKSGVEMVANLRNGITAIKEQATSADALKTALTQALDVSIESAKTKEDFAAINKVIQETGTSASISAQQTELIYQGLAGGSEAVAEHKKWVDEYNQSIDASTRAVEKNTTATQAQANATKQTTEAVKEQTNAMQQATITTVDMSNSMIGWSNQQIAGLQELGLTAEQTNAIMNNLFKDATLNRNASTATYNKLVEDTTNNAVQQAQAFAQVKNEAAQMAQSLSGASVSADDLSQAQAILNRATTISINGLIEMDEQTLDNLRNAISDARQRMQDLASDAKTTAEELKASLAKLKGDENAERDYQQRKKILELEKKIQEARAKGNDDAVKHFENALDYQKRINNELNKQAKQREQDKKNREAKSARNQPKKEPSSRNNESPNASSDISAEDVAGAIDARIARGEQQIKHEAKQEFMQELIEASKRRAR